MSTLTIPNVFSAGQTFVSALMNANFSAISSVLNGNLDSSNLAAGAVTYAKLGTDAKTASSRYLGDNSADFVFAYDTATYFNVCTSITTSGLRPVTMQLDVSTVVTGGSGGAAVVILLIDGSEQARTRANWTSTNELPMTTHATNLALGAGTHTVGFRVFSDSSLATFNILNSGGRVPRLSVYEL